MVEIMLSPWRWMTQLHGPRCQLQKTCSCLHCCNAYDLLHLPGPANFL